MAKIRSSGAETNRWRRERNLCLKAKGDRLALLIRWADVKAIPRGGASVEERRWKARACLKPPIDRRGECWACQQPKMLIRHHVIQLQNGGTNTHLNTEKICDDCHAAIHPWLRTDNRRH